MTFLIPVLRYRHTWRTLMDNQARASQLVKYSRYGRPLGDSTETLEPISEAVLRRALEALQMVDKFDIVKGSWEDLGPCIGACGAAAIYLREELKRTGVID